jgi:hypothetical protein
MRVVLIPDGKKSNFQNDTSPKITAAWQLQTLLDMKTSSFVTAFCLAGSLSLGLLPASAELEVSADVPIHAATDFYEPLTPNGAWVDVGTYGHCWHPALVEVGGGRIATAIGNGPMRAGIGSVTSRGGGRVTIVEHGLMIQGIALESSPW